MPRGILKTRIWDKWARSKAVNLWHKTKQSIELQIHIDSNDQKAITQVAAANGLLYNNTTRPVHSPPKTTTSLCVVASSNEEHKFDFFHEQKTVSRREDASLVARGGKVSVSISQSHTNYIKVWLTVTKNVGTLTHVVESPFVCYGGRIVKDFSPVRVADFSQKKNY